MNAKAALKRYLDATKTTIPEIRYFLASAHKWEKWIPMIKERHNFSTQSWKDANGAGCKTTLALNQKQTTVEFEGKDGV
jgi:hypothetical protein